MKKYLFVAMLVFVVGALAMFAAFATDDAGAFPTGWAGGCDSCHSSSLHSANTTHSNLYSTGACQQCHSGGTNNASTVDASNCLACHPLATQPKTSDGLATAHEVLGNVAADTCLSCHASTVTTEPPTTEPPTTEPPTTEPPTTEPPTTTPPTTTPPTSLSTTSTSPPTTSAPTGGTTSTTLRRATRPFTG